MKFRSIIARGVWTLGCLFTPVGVLVAQSAADGPAISFWGEGRGSQSLFQSEESAATFLAGEGDFLLSSERESSGEVGGVSFEVPLEFNRGYSGIALGAGYAARDLRFDAAPFRGPEYPGTRWLERELYIQEEFFEDTDFAAYDLPPAYPDLQLPAAVPLDDFRFEDVAERRYRQYLLDSTGLPLLSEFWHLPIEEKVFHLEESYFELSAYHVFSGSLVVFGSVTPSAGREQNTPARNGATFRGGHVGAGVSLSESLVIGIGGAYTEDFGAPTVLPWIFITWEPNDWFALEVNVPETFAVTVWPADFLNFSLGLDVNGGGYGLGRRGAADARDQLFITSADAYLGVGYDLTDRVGIELRAGVTVFEEIELYRRSSLLYKYEGEGGGYARFALNIVLAGEAADDFE
jgi:hypothetical protein